MPAARLSRIAEPLLHRLAASLGGIAALGILDHDDLVCVAAASAGQPIPATLQPGVRMPAYRTANGRVLLAGLTGEQVERVLARATPERITPHAIVDKDELARAIQRVRDRGYALAGPELEPGLRTVAVPVKNLSGEVVAAMSIAVRTGRIRAEQMIERCLYPLIKYQVELCGLL